MNFDIEKHVIFEVLSGSRAYGLETPGSDYDYRGVAIPPRQYFLGCMSVFEQHITTKLVDRTVFDIRKFCKLAQECNPNIIELLWVPDKCIKKISTEGEKLLASRELFLSKRAKHTFSGFAVSQLKRIKTHRRWALNPPQKPERKNFDLPESSLISGDISGAIEALEKNGADLTKMFSSEVMTIYQRERAYHNALKDWQNCENYKKTRNPERAALEEKFGYDTKHGTHTVRSISMCREILTLGKVIVERVHDGDLLRAVRNGAWSYDEFIEWAEKQDAELEELYQECTILPHSPDVHKIDALCVELVESFHGIHYEKAAA